MRYSSAVVLSTLAVGHASAATLHNRHASFHARREAAKRDTEAVNWDAIAYDLKDVDWDKVNWSSVFASTPAPTPTPTPEAYTPEPVATTPAPAPEPEKKEETPAPKPTESYEPAEVKVETSNLGGLVTDLLQGVSSIASKLGAKVGVNSKSANGGIWISADGEWGMEVTNSGSKDAVFYCWKANGFSGMSINVNVPEISVGIKAGQKVDLSFAADVPAACAPATANSVLALFGGLHETWAEVTFGQWGAFDVSRNVNMKGTSISMQGSKCTSDMNTCVFKCKDSGAESCEQGSDYDLYNCDAGNGGGGGFDPIMAGTGGGCAMGSSGERIKVSFS